MSVQGATIKRLEFLTSRWEYDIPHKWVWALDIYGVGKAAIDKLLNQYERRDTTRHWPVRQVISLETIRDQLGFCGLAQTVDFPNESFNIGNADFENRGGFIPGSYGDTRNPYGSQNKIEIEFLENNIDIIDYFIKPWLVATSHKGLIEDGDESTNIKGTIEAYLYARARNKDFVPTLRKHITFRRCVPFNTQADAVSYRKADYNDIAKKVSFAFESYTINSIDAEFTTPQITVPIRPVDPTRPPTLSGIPIYGTK